MISHLLDQQPTSETSPLSPGLLHKRNAYWRMESLWWSGTGAARRDRISFTFIYGLGGLVHQRTSRRTNCNLHVRGYKEQGTSTAAFIYPRRQKAARTAEVR